ncbi:hypothetical protein RvY_15499 [Ramazzottius varieornatus]|uniref:Uncharacterized protein n=1 Tax=Ramazzottius varieornatus TaxID=947166 RepID=A0A1D1VWC6_RAMVA|nr:hypothetical protein RvY_15499 [Ramazzottius varieornatus]
MESVAEPSTSQEKAAIANNIEEDEVDEDDDIDTPVYSHQMFPVFRWIKDRDHTLPPFRARWYFVGEMSKNVTLGESSTHQAKAQTGRV